MATVTSKGQITLPTEVRERLHIGTGDQVDFIINENGDAVLRRLGSDSRDLRGLLQRSRKRPIRVEAMNEAILREHSRKE